MPGKVVIGLATCHGPQGLHVAPCRPWCRSTPTRAGLSRAFPAAVPVVPIIDAGQFVQGAPGNRCPSYRLLFRLVWKVWNNSSCTPVSVSGIKSASLITGVWLRSM